MLYSYATKWIGGFSLMCATQSCRATLTTSVPRLCNDYTIKVVSLLSVSGGMEVWKSAFWVSFK